MICRFLQGIWLLTQRKDETNTSGVPKETIAAIIMINKNTKVKLYSLDGNTDFFDNVTGV